MIWRKRQGKDTWHFMVSCSNFPKKDFVQRETKPRTGELCDQCKAKLKKAEEAKC